MILVSDQHYGVGSNIILPGRGINMGDGWETKRNRTKAHKDWSVIQLWVFHTFDRLDINGYYIIQRCSWFVATG